MPNIDPYAADLLHLLFVVLTGLVTFFLPRLLLQAMNAIRDERARRFAFTLVAAAQQHIPDSSARYDWAAKQLSARFGYLSDADIRALLEAGVHALKSVQLQPAVGVGLPGNPPSVAVPVPVPPGPAVTQTIDGQPAEAVLKAARQPGTFDNEVPPRLT